jgi:hypothetical protein
MDNNAIQERPDILLNVDLEEPGNQARMTSTDELTHGYAHNQRDV